MLRWAILAIIILMGAVAVSKGGRDLRLTNMPIIERVASLPPRVNSTKFKNFVNYGAFLPKRRPENLDQPPVGVPGLLNPDEPALGYSYREISILGLPLWVRTDMGLGLYREGSNGYQFVPLDKEYLDLLKKETGVRLEDGYTFSVWKKVWGWVFVLAGALWLFFKYLDERKREEAREIY